MRRQTSNSLVLNQGGCIVADHYAYALGLAPHRRLKIKSPRIWHFGWQWCLTSYGLEAHRAPARYEVAIDRLLADPAGWLAHIAEKTWVDQQDLARTIKLAVKNPHWWNRRPRPPGTIEEPARTTQTEENSDA